MGRGLRSRKLMNIANRIARGVGTKTVAQPPVFFVVISWKFRLPAFPHLFNEKFMTVIVLFNELKENEQNVTYF